MSLFEYDVVIHPTSGQPIRLGTVHAQHGIDAVIEAARLVMSQTASLDPDARVSVRRVGSTEEEVGKPTNTVRTIRAHLQCQIYIISGNVPDPSSPNGKRPVRYLVSDMNAERATNRAWTFSGHKLSEEVSQSGTLKQARDAGLQDEQVIEI